MAWTASAGLFGRPRTLLVVHQAPVHSSPRSRPRCAGRARNPVDRSFEMKREALGGGVAFRAKPQNEARLTLHEHCDAKPALRRAGDTERLLRRLLRFQVHCLLRACKSVGRGGGRSWRAWGAVESRSRTLQVTLVTNPAISLPCGVDEHAMPFGLQVTGRFHGDLAARRRRVHGRGLRPHRALARPRPDLSKLTKATPELKSIVTHSPVLAGS
jgi:hypothetical protein